MTVVYFCVTHHKFQSQSFLKKQQYMTTTGRQSLPTTRLTMLIFMLSTLLVIGCSRVSQKTGPEETSQGIQIEMVEPLFPLTTGPSEVEIRLFDADADHKPIENAKIQVKGDMTHAGMVPVLGESENGTGGIYKIPLEWTMGGDWILQVKAILPDGRSAEKTFPLTITYDPGCNIEGTEIP
jgi:YtkA-like